MFTETITITICDQAENHVGMQKIGTPLAQGLTTKNLIDIQARIEQSSVERSSMEQSSVERSSMEINAELIDLGKDLIEGAHILIIRGGITQISDGQNADDLYYEQASLNWDKKALMRGKVVNKIARHNLCYGPTAQKPDYVNGKGRVIALANVSILASCVDYFNNLLSGLGCNPSELSPSRLSPSELNPSGLSPSIVDQSEQTSIEHSSSELSLVAEGNRYFAPTCGIGFHGDAERKIVIGIRLGKPMILEFRVYRHYKPIEGYGEKIMLNHGDIYFMTEIAAGHNWLKKNIYTLRHAAGSTKYRK